MASVRNICSDANVDSLHTISNTAGKKYLCFTRLTSEALIICATDGFDLWLLSLDDEELEAHRDMAELGNMDAYLSRLRTSFVSGKVTVSKSGTNVILQAGQGLSTLPFTLYEAKAIEKKTELSTILFKLAESVTDLQGQVDKANSKIATLEQSKEAPPTKGGVFDQDVKRKTNKPQAASNMSIINPGSRKRKAAEGVQFE